MRGIKFFSIMIIVVFSTFIMACSEQKENNKLKGEKYNLSTVNLRKNISPKETVEAAFGALTSLNTREFNKYIKYEDTVKNGILYKNNVLFGDNIDDESKDYMESIVSKLSYKIIHGEENGDIATVKVQITNLDLSDIYKRLEEEAVKENSKDEDNLLISLIRSTNKIKKHEVTLSLKKSDKGWKMDMTKEFAKAIYGDMPSFIYALLP